MTGIAGFSSVVHLFVRFGGWRVPVILPVKVLALSLVWAYASSMTSSLLVFGSSGVLGTQSDAIMSSVVAGPPSKPNSEYVPALFPSLGL